MWHRPNALIDVFKWKGTNGWPTLACLSLPCEFKSHKIALSQLDLISLIRSLAKLLQGQKIFCLTSFSVRLEVIWIRTKIFFLFVWWHLQEKGPVASCNISLNLRSLFLPQMLLSCLNMCTISAFKFPYQIFFHTFMIICEDCI